KRPQLVQEIQFDDGIASVDLREATGLAQSGSTVALWDLRPAPLAYGLSLYRNVPYGELSPETIAFTPDGTRLLMGDHFGSNWWWTVDKGRVEAAELFHGGRENSLAFGSDGAAI